MNRLQAIRESIRDDYEKKIAEEQGTNKMKAMEFQITLEGRKNGYVSLIGF